MRIIAESGATKTEWRALNDDGCVLKAHSPGLNPSCINEEGIRSVMSDVIPVLNPEGRSVSEIFFYGAGLVSEESAAPLAEAFQMWCPFAELIFNSDLLANRCTILNVLNVVNKQFLASFGLELLSVNFYNCVH